jgi:hypothetical protein
VSRKFQSSFIDVNFLSRSIDNRASGSAQFLCSLTNWFGAEIFPPHSKLLKMASSKKNVRDRAYLLFFCVQLLSMLRTFRLLRFPSPLKHISQVEKQIKFAILINRFLKGA